MCQTNQKARHIANLFGLYVKKPHRGNGVGYQLLKKAIQSLKESEHVKKIKLTVNKEQQAAIALYEKLGFNIVGKLSNELQYQGKYYDELILESLF